MSARSFGLVVGFLLVSLAGAAGAQPSAKMARIGLLSVGTDPARPGPQWSAFVEALGGLGYTEGGNIAIARRFAGGKSERLASFAEELVLLLNLRAARALGVTFPATVLARANEVVQ